MPKSDFDKFVESQQEAAAAATAVDWNALRQEWLDSLESLYRQIELFLEPYFSSGRIQRDYQEVELNEDDLGSYIAKKMVIRIGRQEVTLMPVGTVLAGSKGRVDVFGPAGESRLLMVSKTATGVPKIRIMARGEQLPPPEPIEWVWKIVSRPPTVRFIELTQEAFLQMILEVANA